ncbi:MAG: phospholipid carrier-dependent glycosyltransferase, partial [Acidobacteriaceae bacterium]
MAIPSRPRSTLLTILLLWIAFYASFTLFTPQLLDDADSVHAEVAREMLLRHDYVTLYANGIRYLEKAPILYWSMAASMRTFQLCGATSPRALTVAARIPLSLSVLALALLIEAFARRLFHTTRSGLYAALILLSSFGIFIFTRINIPDAAVCLFTTLALYCFWRTEELDAASHQLTPEATYNLSSRPEAAGRSGETRSFSSRLYCLAFAAACALNVLTKGLIGVVFPAAIVLLYLLLTRGLKLTLHRLRELHLWTTLAAFLVIAAPWHILAGLANPTQGHPAPFRFAFHYTFPFSLGHWLVPLPTDGNVRGWYWFYFMNEHLLRYLNLRIPHDYDTSPLWLFWGLCFIWLMPWSAFVFRAALSAIRPVVYAMRVLRHGKAGRLKFQRTIHSLGLEMRGGLLLVIWAAFVLLFFALSTRQEYYVLPALPAAAILIAGWLAQEARIQWQPVAENARRLRRAALRCTAVLLALGTLFAAAATYILLHAHTPAPHTDLATLLTEHPSDYALSMGHFLDLDTRALGLFRIPLALAALSLFLGPLISLILRKKARPHAANIALAAGAFGFLLAAHLGLQTFAPVLSSAQLAEAIAPQVHPNDLIVIHGEYEAGSTLAFYLQRPATYASQPNATNFIHILQGRSSNLWYGSFFPDAPILFETPQSLATNWPGPQRIFLWQSLSDPPIQLPLLPGPV